MLQCYSEAMCQWVTMIQLVLLMTFGAIVCGAAVDAKGSCKPVCGRHSQPGCGTNCGRKCSDYPPGSTRVSFVCPEICYLNGCDCESGYVFDNATNSCVVPNDCSIKAVKCTRRNEVYEICPAKCPAGVCGTNDLLVDCAPSPRIGDADCAPPACKCKFGFYRNDKGDCVKFEDCPKCDAKPNEVYDHCFSACPPRRCDVDERLIKCAAPPSLGDLNCIAGCRCADGYKRDSNGTCIPQDQCTPFCNENEIASNCTNGGCFDARYCSQKGRPEICVNLIEGACKKGCLCKKGYLRDELSGLCVSEDKCPETPKCEGQNQVFDYCPAPCPARRCDVNGALIKCAAPPTLGDPECNPGCRCADGYKEDKNGTCIPEDQCDPFCFDNEVASNCTNGGCFGAKYCSEKGALVKCVKLDPASCKKGCLCKEGYLRDELSGQCVLEEKCPATPKSEAPNQIYDYCPAKCPPRRCDVNDALLFCLKSPQLGDPECEPGCRCADGNKTNAEGICVPEAECLPFCGPNEEPSNCVQGGCYSARNCSEIGDPIKCAKMPPESCRKGCLCAEGYLRDDETGKCILEKECPKAQCNGKNEIFDKCPSPCISRKCGAEHPVVKCQAPEVGSPECEPGCRCADGYKRNDQGICIPQDECPSKRCTRANEMYVNCPDCSPQTCETINKKYHCPLQKNTKCKGACRCKPGFYRNKIGDCISKKNCLKCAGKHEFFSCGGACDNVCETLSKQNQTSCPIINIKCNEMCYCESGYARNKKGVCIPIKDCPAPPKETCPGPNEILDDCPPNCSTQSCQNITTECLVQAAVCRPACRCKENYFRNNDDICVTREECSKCRGPNESYNSCAPQCSPQGCSTLVGPRPQCLPIAPGQCWGACRCDEGYYRDDSGTCIPKEKCQPCTAENEVYNECPAFCTARSCSQLYQDFRNCSAIALCQPACICKEGYYRDDNGVCIPVSDCPCKIGETYVNDDGCNTCDCVDGKRGNSICTASFAPCNIEDAGPIQT